MTLIDLTSATRGAVFRSLAAGVPADQCGVFDDVPQDAAGNYLRTGAIETDVEGKGGQRERLTIEVMAYYRGTDRGVVTAMIHAGRQALASVPLQEDGVAFTVPRFLGSVVGLALEQDGVTYLGLSHYEIWAEPA